jgi:signal transduction histidine kinase/CheY-like chemotaxis protein
MAFLLTWSYAGRAFVPDPFYIQVPIFVLIGIASMFSGLSFYRLRKDRQFVAVGLLFLGFFLWGVYLISYPFSQRYDMLTNAGFLFSAVLQLFIAVSMIVLVLEEARHINERVQQEVKSINTEKRELQMKILSAEAQCRTLFQQAQLREELQSAYDELRQTQQSVMQQERLRALGQMASGIAHDINNALSPIVAFSEILLCKEPNLSTNARKNLEHIHTAAEDIAQIVSRMSEFHRRRELNDEQHLVPVSRVIQQVVELTSPCWRDISQSHGFVIEVQPFVEESLPELYCNESELREALTNLVLNAVDALPGGGLITICARAISLSPERAAGLAPSHIFIEVHDNGIGMDESTRQRCLEPFFSTKRQRGGSGLGLAMVYGMVERHDGRIEVKSQLNQGTSISLIFPLRVPAPPKSAHLPVLARSVSGLRVLCIDDEPVLRELLKELLEFHQYQVETADGGQAGLNAFMDAKRRGKDFGVVITDLGMPGVNGREVARKIKGDSPATPIIMLTGWGVMMEDKGEEMPQVDALLSKPPRAPELLETLARVTGVAPVLAATALPVSALGARETSIKAIPQPN